MDADKATASSATIEQNLDGTQALHLEHQPCPSSGELSFENPNKESLGNKNFQPLGQDGNSSPKQLVNQELEENALDPAKPMEESMDFQHEQPEVSTDGAHVLQWAPTALVADNKSDPCGPPFASSGTLKETPLPAKTIPFVSEGISSQLGQFSSFNKNSNINFNKDSSKEFQKFSDCNFLIKADNPELFSELTSSNKTILDCDPSFSSSASKSQVFRFKPIQNSKDHESSNFSHNTSISNGFLQANKNVTDPSTSLKSTATKTFAQAATPQTVTASIPTKGTSPDCGLLVERIKGSSLDDYAKIIETVSGKKTLVFIGQSPENQEKVMAFLENPELVNKLVSSGITVKGRWLCVSYLHQPATKLIVSDVLPFISDELIIKACKTFGQPVYKNLRRIPSSIRAKEYRHVLSFRRELLIVLEKDKQIPDHIVVFSHNNVYKLGITTPGLVCFNCKLQGHRAIFCKAPRSQTETKALPENDHNESIKTMPPGGSSTYASIVAHQVEGLQVLNSIMHSSTEKPDPISKETDYSPPDLEQAKIEENDPKLRRIGSVLHSPYYSSIKKSPSAKSSTWRVIGKKGKATPALKTLSKLAQSTKTPKFGRFSDATWLRQYAPPRDSTQSTDESPDEHSFDQDDPPPDVNINKRKKDKKIVSTNVNDTTTNMDSNNVPPKQQLKHNLDPVFQPEQQASIAQLKKLISQFHQQQGKSKHARKEIEQAQPIIEDLLQSVWSARTAKRRAVLIDFKERHAQLIKYIDAILTLVPATSHGSQIYKSLSGIKQDIKNLSTTDGRKFRNQKS